MAVPISLFNSLFIFIFCLHLHPLELSSIISPSSTVSSFNFVSATPLPQETFNYKIYKEWKLSELFNNKKCLRTFFPCSGRSSLLCRKVITIMKSSLYQEREESWWISITCCLQCVQCSVFSVHISLARSGDLLQFRELWVENLQGQVLSTLWHLPYSEEEK